MFDSADSTFGAVLIDDAAFANRWSRELTEQERDRVAFWEPIITARVYKDLGLELDSVKTLWTSATILYLNRVFSDGIKIPRHIQLACRIDVERNLRFVTHQTRAASCATNRDAAVISGADPLTCAKQYVLDFIPTVKHSEPERIALLILAPQDWGCLGYLHSVCRHSGTDVDPEAEFYHIAFWYNLREPETRLAKLMTALCCEPYNEIDEVGALYSTTRWSKLGHRSYDGVPRIFEGCGY